MQLTSIAGLLVLLASSACAQPPGSAAQEETPSSVPPRSSPGSSGGGTWLQGSIDERFALVAKHLRGFDMAMVETGYRYGELYWAGQDQNWEYASYQLEKIRTAIANGVERRPRRAASARMIEGALEAVEGAIEAGDAAGFASAVTTLTSTCNACHRAEQVPFIQVRPPAQRASPVYLTPPAAPEPPVQNKKGE